MISSYRMANTRISGRGLDSEREKIIRLGQCEKSMRYASCRVWTKREEKERRMVLRISRGEGKKKCNSSIFVPVCLLMEVVGMLKNMRGKG